MRGFINSMNPDGLTNKYPGLNWKEYCKTQQFIGLKNNAKEDLTKAQMKFDFIYGECEHLLP